MAGDFWLYFATFGIRQNFLVFNAFLLEKLSREKWLMKYGISTFFYLLIVGLFMSQPDFGMTLTLTLLWIVQLFIFGLPAIFIIFIGILSIMGAFYSYVAFPHVAHRINKFLGVESKNYQVDRSLDAYVNGGFFGTGPGNGLVKKYIPDAHTDFIFAVVGEEFGLITAIAIMAVFFIIISRVFKRINQENNLFSYLALTGLISQFSLQVLFNIGVSLGMLPTKGMTLPFISYGGSSIVAMAICFGIILALTKKKYEGKIDADEIALE
jgi:cell division protein FtsW